LGLRGSKFGLFAAASIPVEDHFMCYLV